MAGTGVRLHPSCGGCSTSFQAGDRTTVLLETETGFITKVEGPVVGSSDGFSIYDLSFALVDTSSGEADSASFHNDCLNLFTERYIRPEDPIYLAWFLAKVMNPSDSIRFFPPSFDAINPVSLSYVAMELGLPRGFKKLPREIARMIWSHDPSATAWRCSRVFSLLHLDLESGLADQFDGPLVAIYSWERGQRPVRQLGRDALIRLTFDFNGLMKIERLEHGHAESPQGVPSQSSRLYIIASQMELWPVQIEFKYNLARLRMPAAAQYKIWNTPTPPRTAEWAVQETLGRGLLHMKQIETHKCTGLTIFIYPGGIIEGIHAHTQAEPSALKTLQQLAPCPDSTSPFDIRMWVYVPLTENNPIVGFGLRISEVDLSRPIFPQQPCFLFRMKLSHDVAVGTYSGNNYDFVTRTRDWPIIVHDELDSKDVIWNFGAYPKLDGPIEFAPHTPPTVPSFGPYKFCISSASLNNVVKTRVYYNPTTGGCWGILFYYDNGTQASVGQCRILLDRFEECAAPYRLCFSMDQHMYREGQKNVGLIRTKFLTREKFDKHGKGEWKSCRPMIGTMYYFFQNEVASIVIDN